MIVVIILVVARRTGICLVPGAIEDVEARVAGVEGKPRTGVGCRLCAVETAVGLLDIPPAGSRNCAILRPVEQVWVIDAGATQPMVADRGKERDPCSRDRPERRPKDATQIHAGLHQVSVVGLAPRWVAIVAGC